MPLPFPGMDPYLEGYLWPDVHHRLANEICRQLMPHLKTRYVARMEISVLEDVTFQSEIGVMYPDVEVLTTEEKPAEDRRRVNEPALGYTAPVTISLKIPEVRVVTVEVRDTARNRLVTAIELLSPINKREPGLAAYREKRDRLRKAKVHVLEIDLLRRGARTLTHRRIPESTYRVTLIRARQDTAQVWPIRLQDRLPAVPVPLLSPDPDISLDLSASLTAIYAEAAYDRSIDYRQPPPPPPLSPEEAEWVGAQIANASQGE